MGAEETIRVAIADDQRLFANGLARIIGVQRDMEVVGEAHTGEEAVSLCLPAVLFPAPCSRYLPWYPPTILRYSPKLVGDVFSDVRILYSPARIGAERAGGLTHALLAEAPALLLATT